MVWMHPYWIIGVLQVNRRHVTAWAHHANCRPNSIHFKMVVFNKPIEWFQIEDHSVRSIFLRTDKHWGHKLPWFMLGWYYNTFTQKGLQLSINNLAIYIRQLTLHRHRCLDWLYLKLYKLPRDCLQNFWIWGQLLPSRKVIWYLTSTEFGYHRLKIFDQHWHNRCIVTYLQLF